MAGYSSSRSIRPARMLHLQRNYFSTKDLTGIGSPLTIVEGVLANL